MSATSQNKLMIASLRAHFFAGNRFQPVDIKRFHGMAVKYLLPVPNWNDASMVCAACRYDDVKAYQQSFNEFTADQMVLPEEPQALMKELTQHGRIKKAKPRVRKRMLKRVQQIMLRLLREIRMEQLRAGATGAAWCFGSKRGVLFFTECLVRRYFLNEPLDEMRRSDRCPLIPKHVPRCLS